MAKTILRLVLLFYVNLLLASNVCNKNSVTQTKLDRVTSLLEQLKKYSNTINCLFDSSVTNQISGKSGGAVYVRWGRTVCPGNGSEKMYEGYIGGSFNNRGSAANYLCLPKTPTWGDYNDGYDSPTERVYGTEYEIGYNLGPFTPRSFHNHDAPCVVCHSTIRSAVYMIPARTKCYKGWHKEYTGYLMAAHATQKPSEYICVDKNPEKVHGGHENKDGKLLYPVEAACGSLKCPPYVGGRELACTVCTK